MRSGASVGASTRTLSVEAHAEASQATSDTQVHNYDFGIDCDSCHNHGSFMARDTELKNVCVTCHTDGQVASAKQEFDNHLAPSKNPGVDFVDCGVCHELHRPDSYNTTQSQHSVTLNIENNKSFLRANVDKYISTAATPASSSPARAVAASSAPASMA